MQNHIIITKKYLPPPFIGLEDVVVDQTTGKVGYRWVKDGVESYTWEFDTEKEARKSLAIL